MKRKELLVIAALVLAAGVMAVITWYVQSSRDYGSIRITVEGKEYGTYSLGKDQVIHIGDTNTCQIKNGSVTMIEATCHEDESQKCTNQGSLSKDGGGLLGMIVCLPNQVVIELAEDTDSSQEEGPDIIAG